VIKIIYNIKPEDKESELSWLKALKVYPSIDVYFDWTLNRSMIHIGVIVSEEVALMIKLRHELDIQTNYV
jgi:hypothetical protein